MLQKNIKTEHLPITNEQISKDSISSQKLLTHTNFILDNFEMPLDLKLKIISHLKPPIQDNLDLIFKENKNRFFFIPKSLSSENCLNLMEDYLNFLENIENEIKFNNYADEDIDKNILIEVLYANYNNILVSILQVQLSKSALNIDLKLYSIFLAISKISIKLHKISQKNSKINLILTNELKIKCLLKFVYALKDIKIKILNNKLSEMIKVMMKEEVIKVEDIMELASNLQKIGNEEVCSVEVFANYFIEIYEKNFDEIILKSNKQYLLIFDTLMCSLINVARPSTLQLYNTNILNLSNLKPLLHILPFVSKLMSNKMKTKKFFLIFLFKRLQKKYQKVFLEDDEFLKFYVSCYFSGLPIKNTNKGTNLINLEDVKNSKIMRFDDKNCNIFEDLNERIVERITKKYFEQISTNTNKDLLDKDKNNNLYSKISKHNIAYKLRFVSYNIFDISDYFGIKNNESVFKHYLHTFNLFDSEDFHIFKENGNNLNLKSEILNIKIVNTAEDPNILKFSTNTTAATISTSFRRLMTNFACPKDGNILDYFLRVIGDVYAEQLVLKEVYAINSNMNISINSFCSGCLFAEEKFENLKELKKSFYFLLFSLVTLNSELHSKYFKHRITKYEYLEKIYKMEDICFKDAENNSNSEINSNRNTEIASKDGLNSYNIDLNKEVNNDELFAKKSVKLIYKNFELTLPKLLFSTQSIKTYYEELRRKEMTVEEIITETSLKESYLCERFCDIKCFVCNTKDLENFKDYNSDRICINCENKIPFQILNNANLPNKYIELSSYLGDSIFTFNNVNKLFSNKKRLSLESLRKLVKMIDVFIKDNLEYLVTEQNCATEQEINLKDNVLHENFKIFNNVPITLKSKDSSSLDSLITLINNLLLYHNTILGENNSDNILNLIIYNSIILLNKNKTNSKILDFSLEKISKTSEKSILTKNLITLFIVNYLMKDTESTNFKNSSEVKKNFEVRKRLEIDKKKLSICEVLKNMCLKENISIVFKSLNIFVRSYEDFMLLDNLDEIFFEHSDILLTEYLNSNVNNKILTDDVINTDNKLSEEHLDGNIKNKILTDNIINIDHKLKINDLKLTSQKYLLYKLILNSPEHLQLSFNINYFLNLSCEYYLNILKSSRNPFNSFYIEKYFNNYNSNKEKSKIEEKNNKFSQTQIFRKSVCTLITLLNYSFISDINDDISYKELLKYCLWCVSVYSLKEEKEIILSAIFSIIFCNKNDEKFCFKSVYKSKYLESNIYDSLSLKITLNSKILLSSPVILFSLRIIAKNSYNNNLKLSPNEFKVYKFILNYFENSKDIRDRGVYKIVLETKRYLKEYYGKDIVNEFEIFEL